ncbi:M48 family metallopeptidase [Flavobacterium wongokense]|uniref:M48 family metallopeptidase n=1 Tax=Flavobacterium wongokense TaxID=2910674 RepID=UPI001F44243E|nr:M48 family metallopeptidase [Flavobacterium sp. WG47]MCF6131586.1 M48 family metallopeptidase [Flavobacterium sp. WG47]
MIKASLAVLAIITFFALYVLLIIGLGYLVLWAFTYDMLEINKLTILAKIGAIAGSIMLFVFTLKFIFKLKNHKPSNRIKLHKEDYPQLFEFVYQICKETGAPKPKSIYVDPDVNAYVSYTNIWLSLFFPTGKDLTIGLGLVSSLNMSEFKAVMAHEFGHFAQKSMKIGSYIHSANTIIYDMIFNRDSWDELLDKWRGSDIRLSAAAWIITPLIWLIRKALELFYMFLNYMHSALSREMEFNADKVAVKTTGSLAIVSALWKLDFGSNYWNTIVNNAFHATKKKVYTKNLYSHNLNFIEKERPVVEQKFNELPQEESGAKQFFSSSNTSKVNMYASHPPNDHREKNAKTPFVDCEFDKRSPWLIFNKAEQLQEEMTALIYENYLGKTPNEYVSFTDFEKFIESESRNEALTNEFENTFELRFINIPDLEDFKKLDGFEGDFSVRIKEIKEQLKELMIPVRAVADKMLKVQQIASKEIKDKTIEHNGVVYNQKELQECYNILYNERETLFSEKFKGWDELFLQSYYRLAKTKGKAAQLLDLYAQQKNIIGIYQGLMVGKGKIMNGIGNLQANKDVTQAMIDRLANEIMEYIDEINDTIANLDSSVFVALPNIETLEELKDSIIEGGKVEKESGQIFENGGLNKMVNAIENAIISCNRVENKNIDQILSFHKSLV